MNWSEQMIRRVVSIVVALFVLVACAGQSAPVTRRAIIVGMPYIPNVQFAHFYVAAEKGYFAEEGLDVTFDYNFENDVVQRIATKNKIEFALASADSILLARAQGIPVKAVMSTSQEFPVAFMSKSTLPLATPADLKGKVIGIPGRFGASYIGLQALLSAGGLTEADVTIQEIGFSQVPALLSDKVQIISGYANNEPIQLAAQGTTVNVLRVADFYPMASDQLIVNESLITSEKDIVTKFTRALQKGMQTVSDDPAAAYTIALKYIPEAKPADQAVTTDVLKATVAMWQADTTTLGLIQPVKWVKTHELLRSVGALKQDLDVTTAYDMSFVVAK